MTLCEFVHERMSLPRHWSRPSNGHLARLNPAQWSLLQVLSPALRTFTRTLDGWTPPDRRVAALTPPTEPIAQTVGCMARAVG